MTRFTSDSTTFASGTDKLLFPAVTGTTISLFMTTYDHTDGTQSLVFRTASGSSGQPSMITGWIHKLADGTSEFSVGDFSVSPSAFENALSATDPTAIRNLLFAGNDTISGGAANNVLQGLGGDDTISGKAGNDTIEGGEGASYLRGDEGDDLITGGSAFDDINGNMGNDTASGGGGDDWVVGGKDNDSLSGEAGGDLVYGNLGNDTCEGGDGNDIVRGGQQDDVLFGGAGDDYISGDRDNDTVTGGAGADIFHSFGEAGIDRVLDFNRAEGDRVLLDAGTTYTVAQSGADTVVSMTGGGQMILVGVNLASLTDGWIAVG